MFTHTNIIPFEPKNFPQQEKPILMESFIAAGFPSPAEDYRSKSLDLHEHLVKHPAATFFVRVEGDSMINVGIFSGDLLIVDRSLPADFGKIVIALIDDEFTVKRLLQKNGHIVLQPENPAFAPIIVKQPEHLIIWGVVTYVIHHL
ncbi:MAG: translesion error-prone DNA polymerase V autoproteolytic subunit [Alphaproteobacteria bacterium]|nr:translesion error-prone DNA polymerase V autoproteolytic subunit [Alphaproteobacteria bacterium]MDP3533559.1 translesion error-prone DNA polymerase V autoproteolytic subunit [Alphaproteobacteria bacterium]